MRIIETTYWVLEKETEKTVAITQDNEVAKWLLANYPKETILRVTYKETNI